RILAARATRPGEREFGRRSGGASMNRVTVALAALLIALAARPASAQTIGIYTPPANPFARSPISPFLNLNRGGNPAINYYGLVRPQLEAERFMQQQQLLQQQHP